jgi:thiamine biosynthesis lipoprotein
MTSIPLRHLLALAVWAATILPAPAGNLPVVAWEGRTMGTVYRIQLVDPKLPPSEIEALKLAVEQRLRKINLQMSHYIPDSEISRFNRAPANKPFPVSPEFAAVVRFTLDVCKRSNGAFDPTLGPVINLWGFGETTEQHAVPSADEISAALKKTGWRHLTVTDNGALLKDLPGLTINLGGVAKGFGVDEIIRLLQTHKVANAYVSIAGEVRVIGHSPRGNKWRLGISAPLDQWRENDPMAAVVSLNNRSLSTSGDYQNFFKDAQGRRRSHIIDPKTGAPVRHLLGGVSVLAPDSMTADALGTTLFVLGPEAGLKFIDSWDGAAALFIVRQDDGTFRQIPSTCFAALTSP